MNEQAMKKQAAVIALAVSAVLAGGQAAAPLVFPTPGERVAERLAERMARQEEKLSQLERQLERIADKVETLQPCVEKRR